MPTRKDEDEDPTTSLVDTPLQEGGSMDQLARLVARVAPSDISIILHGETGVGKEVEARSIHRLSLRAGKTFVGLNCAALTETLLESELFGHERGAFSGAVNTKPGLFEVADKGTVFLDEIGEMSLSIQPKLLRVLEERTVLRVGGLSPRAIDVRFLAASHKDLEVEVEAGRFREDLYFRLNGITLEIPPLRMRPTEVDGLITNFVADVCRRSRRTDVPVVAKDALALLKGYRWPGNIRELRNIIERAVILCTGPRITAEHLPVERLRRSSPSLSPSSPLGPASEMERERYLDAVNHSDGNRIKAAEIGTAEREDVLFPAPARSAMALLRPRAKGAGPLSPHEEALVRALVRLLGDARSYPDKFAVQQAKTPIGSIVVLVPNGILDDYAINAAAGMSSSCTTLAIRTALISEGLKLADEDDIKALIGSGPSPNWAKSFGCHLVSDSIGKSVFMDSLEGANQALYRRWFLRRAERKKWQRLPNEMRLGTLLDGRIMGSLSDGSGHLTAPETRHEPGTSRAEVRSDPGQPEDATVLSTFQRVIGKQVKTGHPKEPVVRRPMLTAEQHQTVISAVDVPGASCEPALPHPPPRLIGRAKELEALVKELTGERPKATPILGAGGIGKSALARSAIHDPVVVERFGSRRYFALLDGIESSGGFRTAVGDAIGLPGSPWPRVLAAFGEAPSLCVVDNLETPWEADTAGTEEALGQLAQKTLLVATLRGTNSPGGVAWGESIALLPLDHDLPQKLEARRIFLAITGTKFETDTQLPRLLSEMDGLPLAIELLAHRAQGEQTLQHLWTLWQEMHARLLERGETKGLSIRISVEVSLASRRMTHAARGLLSLLALVPSGIARSDVNRIFPENGNEAAKTLTELSIAHYEKSRLRVLNPVAAYVSHRYPPTEAHRAKLVAHYLGLSVTLGAAGAASTRLAEEFEACATVISLRLMHDTPGGAIDAVNAIAYVAMATGRNVHRLLSLAHERAIATHDMVRAARCKAYLALFEEGRGSHAAAEQHLKDAAGLEDEGSLSQAWNLFLLGSLPNVDSEKAIATLTTALGLARNHGDRTLIAITLTKLGERSVARSDHTGAKNYFREAITLSEASGDMHGLISAMLSIGKLALDAGNLASAFSLFDEARALARRLDDPPWAEAEILMQIALVESARDQPVKAEEALVRAIEIYRAAGMEIPAAYCLVWRGNFAADGGDNKTAETRYREALPVLVAPEIRAQCLRGLAGCVEGHNFDEAKRFYLDAIAALALSEDRASAESDIAELRADLARLAARTE